MSDSSQASILIVDDDPASLQVMQEILANQGARLVTASSGEPSTSRSANASDESVGGEPLSAGGPGHVLPGKGAPANEMLRSSRTV